VTAGRNWYTSFNQLGTQLIHSSWPRDATDTSPMIQRPPTTIQSLPPNNCSIIWGGVNSALNGGAYEPTKTTRHTLRYLQSETEDCPAVILNGKHIPQDETVKYLGIHLDRRLTSKTRIFTKRKQLGLIFQRMYWILGRKSELSLANKLLLCKTILKPIRTYDIPLWGSACHSNIEILQRFQKKSLER
jgi:hypothetical protein